MLQHLLRAHSIFLLHHTPSLSDLYARLPRTSFCTLLDRFWTRFIWDWDVLLHGNPAVDVYNGIKLAGGGELGIGVGEEEWGSGEREVLEDFIARTEGLVDLIVSRFGDAPEEPPMTAAGQKSNSVPRHQQRPWLATDLDPRPSDGVLFSGVGAISRRSLATVSQWMADIYKYGEDAYGVGENPTARPRGKKQKLSRRTAQFSNPSEGRKSIRGSVKSPSRSRSLFLIQNGSGAEDPAPGIPPPLVKIVEQSLENASAKVSTRELSRSPTKEQQGSGGQKQDAPLLGTDSMMKYLSLGYGSTWTLNPKGLSKNEPKPVSRRVSELRPHGDKPKEEASDSGLSNEPEPPRLDVIEPTPEVSDNEDTAFVQRLEESIGRFLIGLSGDLENQDLIDDKSDEGPRIVLRTLTVDMHQHSALKREDSMPSAPSSSMKETSSASTEKQLQVAVYIHQPFIFTFLFDLHTPSLTYPSFYRSIHHQLGPLQKPLLRSTDPTHVAARIANAMGQSTTTITSPCKSTPAATALPPIYDLIYDPEKLTIHASLPNIPPPRSLAAEGLVSPQTVSGSWYTLGIPTSSASTSTKSSQQANNPTFQRTEWTRIEALNVHTQILNTYAATRARALGGKARGGGGELERTVKTSRGWWVAWMRVQGQVNTDAEDAENWGGPKEAVLVRRAREEVAGGGKGGGRQFSGMGMGWLSPASASASPGGGRGMRDVSAGSSSAAGGGGGNTGVASVSEGVGVDARRWVEGLLSLNRY